MTTLSFYPYISDLANAYTLFNNVFAVALGPVDWEQFRKKCYLLIS
jgi:hypothetical protein